MFESLEQFFFNLRNKWMYEDASSHIDKLAESIEREYKDNAPSKDKEEKGS